MTALPNINRNGPSLTAFEGNKDGGQGQSGAKLQKRSGNMGGGLSGSLSGRLGGGRP